MSNFPASEERSELDIAIIGMAGRFPGARTVEEFWHNVQNGVESISFFTEQELLAEGADPSALHQPNYVRARGILEHIDLFDAEFFGYNAREAELMDPQQRIFLETAWEALEHAGYNPFTYSGLIGVYAGASDNTYWLSNLLPNRELVRKVGNGQLTLGNGKDHLAARVSYKLNLKGPSLNIQTACSTSLVAVHMACRSLLHGEADIVLAGGVSINVPHKTGYLYREGSIASPDGHCRAFDARAQGTVSGNGVGIVVLKRLEEALADGDYVHAVIKSSAINNDGSVKVGYTAPSIEGQAQAIRSTHVMAEVHPETITYIEAHGTGTELGDPIEIAALTKAFFEDTQKKGFCAIGSVKSNIGHLDVAAGVSGLIKTVGALQTRKIPPSLHFASPNPQIEFANSPFYVNASLADWPAAQGPRRAGVSSFGIGGTNAHVLVEEAPPCEEHSPTRPWQLLLLSARSETALQGAAQRLVRHLQRCPSQNLADIAYTLQVGRKAFGQRLALVCATAQEAIDTLERGQLKPTQTAPTEAQPHPLLFLFPGQGSQYIHMGRDLYQTEEVFRKQIDVCSDILKKHLKLDLREVLYPLSDDASVASDRLRQTSLAQPALFVIEYALAQLWMSWGLQPQAMIGHSIGEYVAACLAGVFSLEDALQIVALRGSLMQALPPGSMLAVPLSPEKVKSHLGPNLSLAATNAPTRTVISGTTEAIEQIEREFTHQGIQCSRLHTSHAFHSAMMEPMLDAFTRHMKRVRLAPPTIPYVSNLTGRFITAAEATDPQYWSEHLRQCVCFAEGLDTLLAKQQWIALEVGPGQILTSFLKLHPRKEALVCSLSSLRHPREQRSDVAVILQALGQFWQAGGNIDWQAFSQHEHRFRVPLPTYPFEGKRYWIEPPHMPWQITQEIDPASQQIHRHSSEAQKQEDIMSEKQSNAATLSRYRAQIMQKLIGIFCDQLGISTEEIDIHTTFFELGADSLLLLQISQAVRDTFNIVLPFRMLFEEVPTIDALSLYIEDQLPEEAPKETSPVQATASTVAIEAQADARAWPQLATEYVVSQSTNGHATNGHSTNGNGHAKLDPGVYQVMASANGNGHTPKGTSMNGHSHAPATPGQSASTNNLPAAASSDMQQIVAQQLQLMAQQLALLSGGQPQILQGSVNPAPPAQQAAQPQVMQSTQQQTTSTKSNGRTSAREQVEGEEALSLKIDPETYVPFKPLQKGVLAGLQARQKAHIEALVARISQKTQKSKQFAQTYRPVLADNRASTGFNQTLKEIIYSIVPERGQGARVWDLDGNEYVDITMGFGALLFGHSPAFLVEALEKQLKKGTLLGFQSGDAGEVAKMICEMTGMERVTFCNSGTEAVMSALRFARATTGRQRIALFTGSFHGTFDGVLVRAQESVDGQLLSLPMAPGVPKSIVEDALILHFGYQHSLDTLRQHAHELAAVLVELPQSRRPDLHPVDFLKELRAITEASGTALIFDEVVTGFRAHPGGASALLGVKPDIATYGKAVGGGLPIGVVAGKALYMDAVDGGTWNYGDTSYPKAMQTFFAGTYFKHPLLMAGIRAIFEHLVQSGPQLQERLNARTEQLVNSLNQLFERLHVPMHVAHFASLFRFFFPPEFKQVGASVFYYNLLDKGVYIPEGRSGLLSTAHTEEDIAAIEQAVEQTVIEMLKSGFFPNSPGTPGGQESRDHEQGSASSKELESEESAPALSTFRGTIIPMTEEQKELWVLSHLGDEAGVAYNEMMAMNLRGPLNLFALHATLQQLVQRHEVLRTTFSADGEKQHIAASMNLPLPVTTLADFSQVTPWMQQELQRPFDLERGPLVRAHLLKLTEQHYVFVLTFHHIIIDGWSVGILLNELGTMYASFCLRRPHQLPATLQYRDYLRWQEQQGPAMQEAERYWLQQFAQGFPILQLPTDHARPKVKTYRGARKSVIIPAELGRELKKLSARKNCSFFSLLLGLFSLFLHQTSGQDDLVVGIPVAGQMAMDGGDFLGHAANLVLVRSQLPNDRQTFGEYLATVKKTLLQVNKHQIYPFFKLVKALNPPRDASRLSVISAVFNLDRGGAFALHELETNLLPLPQQSSRYDLFFNVIEQQGAMLIDCDYDSDLFEESTIERWLQRYQDLMQAVLTNSEEPVSLLPLVSKAERERLELWNDTSVDYEQRLLLHQLFEQQVELHPEKVAVYFQRQKLTYKELNQRADHLAQILRARGVGPNVLVGICAKRSLEMVVGLLGILKAGGAYLPLDPTYPKERISFVLTDTQASLLLTQQELLGNLPDFQGEVLCLNALPTLPDAASTWERNMHDPNQLAYIIYTSGSTGLPKGVMLSHRNVTNFFVGMDQRLGVEGPGVWLALTSISFDISVLELFWTLTRGFEVVIQAELNEADTLAYEEGYTVADQVSRYTVTHLQCTPSLMQILLADGQTRAALSSLRCLMLGGENLPLPLAEELQKLVQGRVLNMYGPTETTIWSSTFALGTLEQGVSIGTPIANTTMYILDNQYRPVPVGVSGELYIGGSGVARGYWQRPALTAERFIPNPFSKHSGSRLYHTGDLARYRSDGCIDYLGRSDDQVKLRGFRIELGEIEAVLHQHPAVQDVAVRVWQDASGISRIAAYVVLCAYEQVSVAELHTYLKDRLPDYMLPQSFTSLPALPLTANGKIDRKALPQPEEMDMGASVAYVAPEGPLEEILAELWCQLLGRERIGRHDNFFDLGGDSILALRIVAKAKEKGLLFQPKQLFQYQTIAELASLLCSSRPTLVNKPAQDIAVPLTPIQHWFFERRLANPHHFNMSVLLEAARPLDPALLEKACRHLIQRHDGLRLRFLPASESQWQAVITTDDSLRFVALNLETLEQAEAETLLIQEMSALQASLRLSSGPLIGMAHIRPGTHRPERVLLIAHHLLVDILSSDIFLEELQTCYTQLSQGQPVELPPLTTTYAQWASIQAEHARSRTFQQEANYWLAPARSCIKPLPVDHPGGLNTEEMSAIATMTLDHDETKALQTMARRRYRTQVSDLVLAALASALATWTNQPAVLIDREGHGRETLAQEVDLSRTIGWFTAVIPTLLQISAPADMHTTLAEVKKQARAIPQGGIGYGLLRYLSQDRRLQERLRHLPPAEISFNYVGTIAQATMQNLANLFTLVQEPHGNDHSPSGTRSHKLEVTSSLENEQLRIEWVYSRDMYELATIQRLAEMVVENLRSLLPSERAALPGVDVVVCETGVQQLPEQQETNHSTLDDSLAGLSAKKITSLLSKLSFNQ